MPLYAINEKNCISAEDGVPNQIYRCLECNAPVRLRHSPNRRPHFYHIRKSIRCRLSRKINDPRQVQLYIQKAIGEDKAVIEAPFPAIRRIADIFWEKEKIVFEIQCSKIDLSEARQRIIDYEMVGLTVVWLLDDRVFNKKRADPCEIFLRKSLCYFFTVDQSGRIYFYDQLELLFKSRRSKTSYPLQVNLSCPKHLSTTIPGKDQILPDQILQKQKQIKRYFHGDLLDRAFAYLQKSSPPPLFTYWKTLEKEAETRNLGLKEKGIGWLKNYLIRPYLAGLDRLIKSLFF